MKAPRIPSRVSSIRKLATQASTQLDSDLRIPGRGRKLAMFATQFTTLLQSGVPLVQTLEALRDQSEDPVFALVLESVVTRVSGGARLSQALGLFRGVFPPVFTGMVAVGENTGGLVQATDRLGAMLQKEERLNQRVRGALSYPIFVVVLTGALTIIMFRFVLPTFVDFFASSGQELPLVTRLVLALTQWSGTVWFWTLCATVALAAWRLGQGLWAHPLNRLRIYRLMLRLPLLGEILQMATLARFCWVMQLCLATGLELVRSLQLAADASHSPVLQFETGGLQSSVREGGNLSAAMARSPAVFPGILRQLVLLGEEATGMSDCFGYAAGWFEEELDSRIEVFKSALEPLLMTGIGLMVGCILLSVFLPLYGLLDKL
ncbi:MAG: type II secretion system F family protein [Vulcanimicrobiota bacterium]